MEQQWLHLQFIEFKDMHMGIVDGMYLTFVAHSKLP